MKRPEDTFADTGAPGDLTGTAAPAGAETLGMDPLAAVAPTGGPDQQGISAMLNPSQGAVPTSGPDLGAQLSASITNPGDAALQAQQGGDMMGGGGVDPTEIMAQQNDQALQDPNLPPDERAQLLQELNLAARRRLAGV